MNQKRFNDPDTTPDCKLLDRLTSPLENLANLTFLTLEATEQPEKVHFYMHMAEKQMLVIRQIALETYTA